MTRTTIHRPYKPWAGSALALCLCSFGVEAAVPGSVDPSQVEKRFEPSAPQRPMPEVTVVPSPIPMQKFAPLLSTKIFTLRHVTVEGNTVFTDEQLSFAYRDYLGKDMSLIEAQAIAKRITDRYRSQGYILSQASVWPQDTTEGNVTIRVVEGHISRVKIQGDVPPYVLRDIPESYSEALIAIQPVRIYDVERALLLIGDLPGMYAKGVVQSSATEPGSADLTITLSRTPYTVSYSLDNRGSKYIGPYQHTVTANVNSLFGMYDRNILRVITTSPTSELRFVDYQHEQPLDGSGTKGAIILSHSTTAPGDTLSVNHISGRSEFMRARITHPFVRLRNETVYGRAMVDARNTTIDTAGAPTSNDKLRVLRAGASYDFADRFSGVNLVDAEISRGIEGFGASDSGDRLSRSDGESGFTKANLDFSHTHPLPQNFSLYTAGAGQYSLNRLLIAEQYSLGGDNYARAHDPAAISGDHALAGKAELRWDNPVNYAWLHRYQLYGFYDIGRVWLRDSSSGNGTLSSAGAGIRADIIQRVSGRVEIAKPLGRDVTNQGNHGDDPRLFFVLNAIF